MKKLSEETINAAVEAVNNRKNKRASNLPLPREDRLRTAMWFIEAMGSVGEAERVFGIAIKAKREMDET